MWQEIYQSNFCLLQIEGPDRRAADILDKGQCQLWPREIQGSRIFKQTTNMFKRYNSLAEYDAVKVVFRNSIGLKNVSFKHLKPFLICITIEPQCHFALQWSLKLGIFARQIRQFHVLFFPCFSFKWNTFYVSPFAVRTLLSWLFLVWIVLPMTEVT